MILFHIHSIGHIHTCCEFDTIVNMCYDLYMINTNFRIEYQRNASMRAYDVVYIVEGEDNEFGVMLSIPDKL